MSELEDLMGFRADVVLEFEDGTLEANSTALGLFSSVLRGAVEAHTAATAGKGNSSSSGGSNSGSCTIPIEGVSKEEWLAVAPFWYPVKTPPAIQSFDEIELLLRVGARYDLQPALHKADAYIVEHMGEFTKLPSSPLNIWKWLQAADAAGLHSSVPLLAQEAALMDRAGGQQPDNLAGLSTIALRALVKALTAQQPEAHCNNCSMQRKFTVVSLGTMRCAHCNTVYRS